MMSLTIVSTSAGESFVIAYRQFSEFWSRHLVEVTYLEEAGDENLFGWSPSGICVTFNQRTLSFSRKEGEHK